jgi:hypothetical protein
VSESMEEEVKKATTEAMESATLWNPVPLKRYTNGSLEIAIGYRATWRTSQDYVVAVGENVHQWPRLAPWPGGEVEKVGYESADGAVKDGWVID